MFHTHINTVASFSPDAHPLKVFLRIALYRRNEIVLSFSVDTSCIFTC